MKTLELWLENIVTFFELVWFVVSMLFEAALNQLRDWNVLGPHNPYWSERDRDLEVLAIPHRIQPEPPTNAELGITDGNEAWEAEITSLPDLISPIIPAHVNGEANGDDGVRRWEMAQELRRKGDLAGALELFRGRVIQVDDEADAA